jgi:hypothetical protein
MREQTKFIARAVVVVLLSALIGFIIGGLGGVILTTGMVIIATIYFDLLANALVAWARGSRVVYLYIFGIPILLVLVARFFWGVGRY